MNHHNNINTPPTVPIYQLSTTSHPVVSILKHQQKQNYSLQLTLAVLLIPSPPMQTNHARSTTPSWKATPNAVLPAKNTALIHGCHARHVGIPLCHQEHANFANGVPQGFVLFPTPFTLCTHSTGEGTHTYITSFILSPNNHTTTLNVTIMQ